MAKRIVPAFLTFCVLGWAGLSACSNGGEATGAAQSQSQAQGVVQAKFRYAARETYRAARSQSCEPASVDYATALSDEIAAFRNLEAQTRSTAAGFQLSVAKADVELERTGCWADDDPRFAERHVAMARENLTFGLEALSELASSLPAATPEDSLSAAVSAAFRAQIVSMVVAVNPVCQLMTTGSNEQITAPATARLAGFKRQITGTAFALHFAIAQADVLYLQSITLVECASPRSGDPEAISATIDEAVASQITAIERQFFASDGVH